MKSLKPVDSQLVCADLMFAKVSAFSTRGFARDLVDLYAIDQQRKIDWKALLAQAGRASDNDYNPAEFHVRLQLHGRECATAGYREELPVTNPPPVNAFRLFMKRLQAANQAVVRKTLR